MTSTNRYLRYRAPAEDGQVLCVPPWKSVEPLVANNRAEHANRSIEIAGRSLSELATEARRELLTKAERYTRGYADVGGSSSVDRPMILTGHQPELVHPGVWLKNFAAARLAAQIGGVSINLLVDSDLCRTTSIRIPTGDSQDPRVESIAYDQTIAEQPYEERPIVDRATWNSFGSRAAEVIKPLVNQPLVAPWWAKHACRSNRPEVIGQALAQARHRLELDWGSESLELPQSEVCKTAAFRRFAAHLLAEADSFRAAYNQSLHSYRQVHQIRNHAQPVLDLTENDGWIETPFWTWSTDQPVRRALFAQPRREEIALTDREGWQESLPYTAGRDAEDGIEQLREWESRGRKIRTRALATTMFARLLLSDLFIHGIGGAKYDQVTDGISERFFGFAPPAYLAMSATLRLPIDHDRVLPGDLPRLHRELRSIRYHPETLCEGTSLAGEDHRTMQSLIAQKQTWVRTPKTHANAAERHRQIVAANEGLQRWLVPRRESLLEKIALFEHQSRANELLESREYPFCLFPQDNLRDFLLDFSSSIL